MTALQQAVADYLSLRRALGFKLERAEKLLGQFVRYLADHDTDVITTEVALAWALLPASADPRWWDHRLATVLVFAAFLHAPIPVSRCPPRG